MSADPVRPCLNPFCSRRTRDICHSYFCNFVEDGAAFCECGCAEDSHDRNRLVRTKCTNILCKKIRGKPCKEFYAESTRNGVAFCECGCSDEMHNLCQPDEIGDEEEEFSIANFSQPQGVLMAQACSNATTTETAKKLANVFTPNCFSGLKTSASLEPDVKAKKTRTSANGKEEKSEVTKRPSPPTQTQKTPAYKTPKGKEIVILDSFSDDEATETTASTSALPNTHRTVISRLFPSVNSTPATATSSRSTSSRSALSAGSAALVPGRVEVLVPDLNGPQIVILYSTSFVRESHWEVPRSLEAAKADAHREGAPDMCLGTDADPPMYGEATIIRAKLTPYAQKMVHQSRYCFGCRLNHPSGEKFLCKGCHRWTFMQCAMPPASPAPNGTACREDFKDAWLCCICNEMN